MSIAITAWAASNYLTNLHTRLFLNNVFDRLSYVFAYCAVIAGWRFSYYFSVKNSTKIPLEKRIGTIIGFVFIILSLTTYVSGSAKYQGSKLAFSTGALIIPYSISLLIFLSLIIRNLSLTIKKGDGREKQQAFYILIGFSTTIVLALISNVIIPSVSSSWQTTNFGPILSLLLVSSITYAIFKHRLFDFRLVIARSLAYALSLLTLVGLFTLSAFAVTSVFFNTNDINSSIDRFLYAFLAVILAFIFTPLKRFFDRLTNRFFYQDAYDSQKFLSQFNQALVATYELAPLLRQGSKIIELNLKPSFVVFGIKETKSTSRRLISTDSSIQFTEKDIDFVKSCTRTMNSRVIMTDQLGHDKVHFKEVLQSNNIAVIARLTSSTREEGIGYLILGPKKSGSPYGVQDISVIEIIANELVIAIQNLLRFEEIENFNLTLQERVNDATRKLRLTNQKLKDLDETKDDFISMASHQLRTPLTSVKGYISIVMEEDAGKINKLQREMLGQAFFSSQRMVYLIADLLNVSRLKSGKFNIDPIRVNLANMVHQELEQLEETAASRSLTIQYEKPVSFPDLMFDETKIRQVIMNFVDNAIYYTPAGGHIIVRLIDTATTIEFRVEDNGIGVPKNEQQHLFTKFYRAGNARQSRPDGTGLGLYMAKKVIIAQGGATIFESIEGKGSTFGFVFGKSALTPPPESKLDANTHKKHKVAV